MPGIPEPVARVAELMSTFPAAWCLCGGWAVDAWLGRQTRNHGDIDVSIFEEHEGALFDHLGGWHLIAHDKEVAGNTTEPWDGRHLRPPAHIHAGLDSDSVSSWVKNSGGPGSDGFKLEVVIDQRAGDEWLLNLEPPITLAVSRSIGLSTWTIPTAVPEVILFYKATAYFGNKQMKERPDDEADLFALLPGLSAGQRQWFFESVRRLYPDHPWLSRLSA